MTQDEQIIAKAIEEIESKSFGVTEKLFEIHEVVYQDGKPQVLRIDKEAEDGTVIIYFPIKDQQFYLAIYLETVPEIDVKGVDTEDYHSVYFRATSEAMSLAELCSMTKLSPTGGWSKGDKRRNGKSFYNFSSFEFQPKPGPDSFEDKLEKLLYFLEQDKDGILNLVDKAYGHIQVASNFHNGNGMLGGHHLNKDIIRRIASLNLEIDFDLYCSGNKFKE